MYNMYYQIKTKYKSTDLKILHYNCLGITNKIITESIRKNQLRYNRDIRDKKKGNMNPVRRRNGNYLFYNGTSKGYRGVGFYVNERIINRVMGIKLKSERVAVLKIKVSNRIRICIR